MSLWQQTFTQCVSFVYPFMNIEQQNSHAHCNGSHPRQFNQAVFKVSAHKYRIKNSFNVWVTDTWGEEVAVLYLFLLLCSPCDGREGEEESGDSCAAPSEPRQPLLSEDTRLPSGRSCFPMLLRRTPLRSALLHPEREGGRAFHEFHSRVQGVTWLYSATRQCSNSTDLPQQPVPFHMLGGS